MNGITNPPNTYDFGKEFNYAQWPIGTKITMVNVPWNNDYRDIVKFDTRAELNTYIDSLESAGISIPDMSYVKPNTPIRIPTPFNPAFKYNYLRATNPLQPVNGDMPRDMYYFVTAVNYVAPQTTEVVLQLDVWQTFGFDVEFGNCYIDRGHIGIANSKGFDNYGRDYLAVPEGLDIGSDYVTVARRNRTLMPAQDASNNTSQYGILVVSTIDLTANSGTVDNPKVVTAKGDIITGLPSGAEIYYFTPSDFTNFMSQIGERPWVSQGILSVTAIPVPQQFGLGVGSAVAVYGTSAFCYKITGANAGVRSGAMFTGWRTHADIVNYIPQRYRHLKKILTSPFTIVELTAFNGRPLIIKPEIWNNADGAVTERMNIAPPNQRIVATPVGYNARTDAVAETWTSVDGTKTIAGDDGGDWLDFSTVIDSFPTFAIVSNQGIAYLANNARSLGWQNQAADWSQQRALRGNQNSYDQASAGIDTAYKLNDIGVGADLAQTNLGNSTTIQQGTLGAISGILGGGAQGALGGATAGPAGAAIGAGMGVAGGAVGGVTAAIGMGINTGAASASQAIRAAAARSGTNAAQGNSAYVRDTNKTLADWAANGDYENTIAGINAKVQDAQMAQPSVNGQVGGDAFNMIHRASRWSLRIKMMDLSAIRSVGEYWLRYGYAVRSFVKPPASLMVMSKFTYWKLLETYIVAAPMPETFKQSIRGIFEKGVTVWVDPADIGNIDIADNTPLEGVSY